MDRRAARHARPMKWTKKGLIFAVHGQAEWMTSHACVPIADKIDENRLRIYFGPRDGQGRTTTTFIEVEADNPANILHVHDRPVLGLGKLGAFDDGGAMPSCIVNHDGRKYLYYMGWNRGVSVPFRNSIGLAVSSDGGLTFGRACAGPIMDRSPLDPYFVSAPYVLIDDGRWKMWYISCTEWLLVRGHPEPVYQIKYAESSDGLRWSSEDAPCLPYKFAGEAISRPSVLKEPGRYRMWYCFRGSDGYRAEKSQSYRIGYAESPDGRAWARQDERVGIEPSQSGWDALMMENPCVYEHEGRKYMLYNGDGFGATGFGYAVLDEAATD